MSLSKSWTASNLVISINGGIELVTLFDAVAYFEGELRRNLFLLSHLGKAVTVPLEAPLTCLVFGGVTEEIRCPITVTSKVSYTFAIRSARLSIYGQCKHRGFPCQLRRTLIQYQYALRLLVLTTRLIPISKIVTFLYAPVFACLLGIHLVVEFVQDVETQLNALRSRGPLV